MKNVLSFFFIREKDRKQGNSCFLFVGRGLPGAKALFYSAFDSISDCVIKKTARQLMRSV